MNLLLITITRLEAFFSTEKHFCGELQWNGCLHSFCCSSLFCWELECEIKSLSNWRRTNKPMCWIKALATAMNLAKFARGTLFWPLTSHFHHVATNEIPNICQLLKWLVHMQILGCVLLTWTQTLSRRGGGGRRRQSTGWPLSPQRPRAGSGC